MTKETPFINQHRSLGAKVVEFAGFWMPLQYTGQIAEHEKVRREVGLFDLTHMGEFEIRGPGALEFANRVITNDVAGKPEGAIVYSPVCRPDGGIVDDVLAYRRANGVYLVVNAANIAKDLAWIRAQAPSNVTVDDVSDETALLAVQGPRVEAMLKPHIGGWLSDMGYYQFRETTWEGVPLLISRTGYTGEDGFELFFAPRYAGTMWDRLVEAGKPFGIGPIGLAARDTLRLEVGYCLYGNDLDDTTSPLEAGLAWTVKMDKPDFIGKAALAAQKAKGLRRRLVGLNVEGAGMIARHGMNVVSGGESVGVVTSGTLSPTLRRAVAMAYVVPGLAAPGTKVQVDIRGRLADATVCKLPFYTQGTRKK